MNCPSRNDDAESKHPTWNQNPPFLATDLTTCQDLNGITNLREHRGYNDEVDHWLAVDNVIHLEKPPDGDGERLFTTRRSVGEFDP